MKICTLTLLIGCIASPASDAAEIGPVSEYGYEEAPNAVKLELVRLFAPRGRGIVGRFKLTNNGNDTITFVGNSTATEIIAIQPTLDATGYATFHRAGDKPDSPWLKMAQILGVSGAARQSFTAEPGQKLYLDITLPNSPAYFADEWLVQLTVSIFGEGQYVNSIPFEAGKKDDSS